MTEVFPFRLLYLGSLLAGLETLGQDRTDYGVMRTSTGTAGGYEFSCDSI
jgi:hypothetical protein